jgi:hypothetical protein
MNTAKLTVPEVVELMRDDGRHIALMHNVRRGREWYLIPGGKLKDDVVQALLAREDIQPSRDGLFPGISQTFVYRRVA